MAVDMIADPTQSGSTDDTPSHSMKRRRTSEHSLTSPNSQPQKKLALNQLESDLPDDLIAVVKAVLHDSQDMVGPEVCMHTM